MCYAKKAKKQGHVMIGSGEQCKCSACGESARVCAQAKCKFASAKIK